jgi:hypothetical protein
VPELVSGFNVECAGIGWRYFFFCPDVLDERTAFVLKVSEFRSGCC